MYDVSCWHIFLFPSCLFPSDFTFFISVFLLPRPPPPAFCVSLNSDSLTLSTCFSSTLFFLHLPLLSAFSTLECNLLFDFVLAFQFLAFPHFLSLVLLSILGSDIISKILGGIFLIHKAEKLHGKNSHQSTRSMSTVFFYVILITAAQSSDRYCLSAGPHGTHSSE